MPSTGGSGKKSLTQVQRKTSYAACKTAISKALLVKRVAIILKRVENLTQTWRYKTIWKYGLLWLGFRGPYVNALSGQSCPSPLLRFHVAQTKVHEDALVDERTKTYVPGKAAVYSASAFNSRKNEEKSGENVWFSYGREKKRIRDD